jgi:hypothetical protein
MVIGGERQGILQFPQASKGNEKVSITLKNGHWRRAAGYFTIPAGIWFTWPFW